MRPLGELTTPRMLAYASRHGMDFRCYRQPLLEVSNGIYWTGVVGAIKGFGDGYDKVMYLDADQCITNLDFEFPDWGSGFHVSRDWGQDAIDDPSFSMCGFIVYRQNQDIFHSALALEESWRDKEFPEQGPIQYLYKTSPAIREQMQVHPRRAFNAVPIQVHPSVVEPWTHDCWCAHITMLSVPERVSIFHRITT
jgi:hypothetical protein